MQYFPVFLDLNDKIVVVAGGGQTALAKIRLLIKTNALIHVFSDAPIPDVEALSEDGKIHLHCTRVTAEYATVARMCYAADEDDDHNHHLQSLMQNSTALFNWVDKPAPSDFITPAMVDRDPIVVAIGTEGAAPVVARTIKKDLEDKLPLHLGHLAALAKPLRFVADKIEAGLQRRKFWAKFFFDVGPDAFFEGGNPKAEHALKSLADQFSANEHGTRPVHIAEIGTWEADMLPHKTRLALHEADVVVLPKSTPKSVRELIRREALLVGEGKDHFAQMHDEIQQGHSIVRLCHSLSSSDLMAEIAQFQGDDLQTIVIPSAQAAPQNAYPRAVRSDASAFLGAA